MVYGTFELLPATWLPFENSSRVHLWCPRKLKISIRFQFTRMHLVQCTEKSHWTTFELARMILADATAVARQSKTRIRPRGSTWVHHQTKTMYLFSAHAGSSCTICVAGSLGHVLVCLADPSRFYGRGKTGLKPDFCKIRYPKNCLSRPAKRAPAPLGDL